MLRTIVLHGALGERFGASYRLDVVSPAQAVRALVLQLKGFREHLRAGAYRVTRIRRGRPLDLGTEALTFPLGGAEELHFVPVIAGAGGSRGAATGKTIAGAVLVAVALTAAFALGGPGGAMGLGATIGGTGITLGNVAAVGLAVALSGVAGLLTKTPGAANNSFMFGGQDNVTTQGGPVPLVIGLTMAGSVTISAGLFTEALSPGTLPFDPSTTPRVVYYLG